MMETRLEADAFMPGPVMRVGRRIRQFVRGVTASVSAEELQQAAEYLPLNGLARFQQMPVDAQRHSLNVLTTLQRAGWHDPDLAAAALLHDVGKVAAEAAGLTFNAWIRTALVLMEAVAPRVSARLAVNEPTGGWRYLLYVHLAHPTIGAHWAEADGCSPLTCWLIAHHQLSYERHPVHFSSNTEPAEIPNKAPQQTAEHRQCLLTALQWADSRN